MRATRIELLPSAQADIDQITDDLMEKNTQAAVALLNDIERATGQLLSFPEVAPMARDERLAREGYRVMLLKYGYLMFYKIHDDAVFVYRVVDGRRNYGAFIN